MNIPNLPLRVKSSIEPTSSWEGLSTPTDLAFFMAKVLSLSANELKDFEEIVFSNSQPTGDEASKIWIKTDEPLGIGIPVGKEYQVIYQHPKNIPFVWNNNINVVPSYLRPLTDEDLKQYGFTKPISSNYVWVIFE